MRRAATLAALITLTVLLIAAVALAASESVSISGPNHIKAGHKLRITVTVQASTGRRLAVFSDTERCASRFEDEFGHPNATELLQQAASGNVVRKLTVHHSPAGTDHICAYIYHRQVDNAVTDARARFKFVVG